MRGSKGGDGGGGPDPSLEFAKLDIADITVSARDVFRPLREFSLQCGNVTVANEGLQIWTDTRSTHGH